jgi:hypothetical protein
MPKEQEMAMYWLNMVDQVTGPEALRCPELHDCADLPGPCLATDC